MSFFVPCSIVLLVHIDGDIVLGPRNGNFNKRGPCILFFLPKIASITISCNVWLLVGNQVTVLYVWLLVSKHLEKKIADLTHKTKSLSNRIRQLEFLIGLPGKRQMALNEWNLRTIRGLVRRYFSCNSSLLILEFFFFPLKKNALLFVRASIENKT